jgi:hypothetical protein
MTPPRRGCIAVFAILLSFLLVLVTRPACGGDADESLVAAPGRVTIRNGVVILTLSGDDQRNAGIVTERPGPAPPQHTLAGYGEVVDPAALTALSNRLLETSIAVRVAEAKLTVSRAEFERARLLHRDQQNISAAQLQTAEGKFAVDQAELAAARARQDMVAAGARQAWGDTLATALIGHAPLITDLIERREYLVKVTLPAGETITRPPVTATGHATTDVPLEFISAAAAIDPTLQGVSYFYAAQAAGGLLPGLRLAVSLPGGTAAQGVVVPESAVVWLQGSAWIYVRTGSKTFERRQISPEHAAPGGGYIVRHIQADAPIVVRGAQMLLSEEFRAQAPIED